MTNKSNKKRKNGWGGPRPVGRNGHNQMTSEERAVFDVEVARLRLNGTSFEKIAQATGRSKDTCHKAYKRFMVEFQKNHQQDQSVLLSEYHYRMERIWNAHLAKYSTTIDKKTGVGDVEILRKAGELYNNIFDRLQSAGLLPKRSEKLKFEGQQEIKFVIEDQFKKSKKKKSVQHHSNKPRKQAQG